MEAANRLTGAQTIQQAASNAPGAYSPSSVQASLLMFQAALQAKQAHIETLHATLSGLPPSGITTAADSSVAARATAADDSRSNPQAELAALRQQLAAAQARLLAERAQRGGIKAQVAAVKAELGGAREVQEQALADLAATHEAVESAISELRRENEELKETLVQRESAYLSLLETVQELFRQHSPTGSGEQSPGWAGAADDGDVGARLQAKLSEWQQRLESAAHLKSAEADRSGSAGGSAGATSSRSKRGGQASHVAAAIEAAAAAVEAADCVAGAAASDDEAVSACSQPGDGASCASSVASLHSARSSPAASRQVTPAASPIPDRIQAVRPEGAAAPAAAAPASTPGKGDGAGAAGSRIKQLGIQAASSPVQKPAAGGAGGAGQRQRAQRAGRARQRNGR